jgi:hypothetical protein
LRQCERADRTWMKIEEGEDEQRGGDHSAFAAAAFMLGYSSQIGRAR